MMVGSYYFPGPSVRDFALFKLVVGRSFLFFALFLFQHLNKNRLWLLSRYWWLKNLPARLLAACLLKKMALTESTMLPLGTVAPDFTLPDTVSGREVSLNEIATDKGAVVMFLCNHCPYVIHVNEEIVRVANEYSTRGIGFVAISSNDVVNYPADAPDKMKIHAREVGYSFPYLYDESQAVARAYDAACTPDFYVFDKDRKLVYRGRLDDSRPGSGKPLTGRDLRAALDAVLVGADVSPIQYPSAGCGIKWKR